MRLHDLIDELYESCFDIDGEPNYNLDSLEVAILKYRKAANIEIDLIKSAATEYCEYVSKG